MPNIVLNAAMQDAESGRSVLYIEPGTKYPRNIKGGWTPYQTTPATPRQLRAWFQDKERGLCIITGPVSGSIGDDGTIYALEIKDFDESGLYEEWCQEAWEKSNSRYRSLGARVVTRATQWMPGDRSEKRKVEPIQSGSRCSGS